MDQSPRSVPLPLILGSGATTRTESKTTFADHGAKVGRVILMEWSDERFLDERAPRGPGSLEPSVIAKVESFCRENYARSIGVAEMAAVAKLSRFHFSRLFLQARGLSPGQYLNGLRLVMAMRLIRSGEHAVKDVAKLCGFASSGYFCRVFRQTFGLTPGRVVPSRPLPAAPLAPRSPGPRNWARHPTTSRKRPT
jgi:AraC-like DNA-binding protein